MQNKQEGISREDVGRAQKRHFAAHVATIGAIDKRNIVAVLQTGSAHTPSLTEPAPPSSADSACARGPAG